MDVKDQHEFKRLAETFWDLRTTKLVDGVVRKAALDHGPYAHLHEGPDLTADLEMSFCPMCHQDYIVKRLTELTEVQAEFVPLEVPVVKALTDEEHDAKVKG